jgi:coproporphyrinogen III oxidase-like Fe-S oxidoreductase
VTQITLTHKVTPSITPPRKKEVLINSINNNFEIIRNHDGMITIDSEPGKGTKVVIYLPSAKGQQSRLESLS